MQGYNIHINITQAKYSLHVCSRHGLHSKEGTTSSAKYLFLSNITLSTPSTCIMAIPLNSSTSDFSSETHVQIQTFSARASKTPRSCLRRGSKHLVELCEVHVKTNPQTCNIPSICGCLDYELGLLVVAVFSDCFYGICALLTLRVTEEIA